ncbi:hypothetical protein SteCoe_17623 [Stentor coeruleus]|uniref:CSD domain-containing protein n=1 Tax=Stentor coeruleus TaxID=5963 RepID=A0A1R2BYY2_9CILI|nr:hypothetical protein SteCoe_17623 [Stentor coeruleus]
MELNLTSLHSRHLSSTLDPTFSPYSPFPGHTRSSSNVFFNSSVSILELKKISENTSIEELYHTWGETQKKFKEWASNSSSPAKTSPAKFTPKLTKYPFLLTPPPGFEKIKPILQLSDISTESEISPSQDKRKLCKVIENDVKLQAPPFKYGLIKREKRGTFDEECVLNDKFQGEIKFYQLKKRFGFISLDMDKSDVFLCEDDLVLSGVSIKKFKEAIFKKIAIRFEFYIKNYNENGADKRKAVDINLLTDIN